MQQFGAKTLLTIPLQIGGRPIAYAKLWESRQRREFTPAEISLCQGIAQQTAIAIENARLFKQTQVALEETAVLYQLAHSLAQMDNDQQIFELVLTVYLQYLNLQQGGVLIFGDDKRYGTLKACMVAGRFIEPDSKISLAGNPSYEQLLKTRNPVVITDTRTGSRSDPVHSLTQQLDITSLLLIPILVRGEVIGALRGEATRTIHEFSNREISMVEAMATQLAIAIENRRLNAETQRRAEQLAALHELDRAITASLRLTDTYHAFARHATRLLPYDRISVALLDGDNMCLTYVHDQEGCDASLTVGSTLSRQTSAMGWVVSQGQPMLRHSIETNIRFPEDKHLVAAGLRSSIIVPLRVKGQVIGTWNISSRQVGFYGPDDLEIAQSMADQLAIAIDNGRLYHEIHLYLDELTALNKISQTITSTLDLHKTLTIITDQTTRLLGVAAATVALYDEANDDLWFAAASGGNPEYVRDKRLRLGQGVLGWVVQQGKSALIPDVSKDPRFWGAFDQESGFSTYSILCVPLQTRGQVIGAIETLNKENGPFDQEDLRLLTSLAAPAATAIENARLYEQAQQELTERKRVEAALEEERALLARRVAERTADLSAANVELARAARLKDEFLASMSHELRTPLTAVLGMSDVLTAEIYGPLNEKQLHSVQSIESSGRHLLSLITDILDLSKIEADKLDLRIGLVSVAAVCQASLQLIKQSANKKQITVSSKLDQSATTLQADERRLKQILVNLLSNAVKFTPEGGEIGLEVEGDPAHHLIHFIVWDKGIGIAPEDKPRLFQPFVQLDSSLSRQYTGTGLGLALVRRMAEIHGGSVSLETELGRGSRFTISLPWHEPNQGGSPVDDSKPIAPDMPDISAIRRVLIIEDSPTTAGQLTRYLEKLGIETAVHCRGEGAVNRALEVGPDVIILDILLPDSTGWDVLAQLKAEPRTQSIPVLIVSVIDEPSRGMVLGAAGYLIKPVSSSELQVALGRIAAQRAGQAGRPALATKPASPGEKDQAPQPTQSPLILIVEDQDQTSTFLVDFLARRKGYRVVVARDGAEALEQARKEKPDVILMDVQMPNMDGLEATRRLRAEASLASIPVIALTALAMPGDRERCLEAGANTYLKKPVNLNELIRVIQAHLTQNQTRKGNLT